MTKHQIQVGIFEAATVLFVVTMIGSLWFTIGRDKAPSQEPENAGLMLMHSADSDAVQFNRQIGSTITIPNVAFEMKRPDFGGEACVAMFTKHLGHAIDQDYVFDLSGVDPMLGRGCISTELLAAVKRLGYQPGVGFYRINHESQDKQFEENWKRLQKELAEKRPSVFCIRRNGIENFVLVLGVDLKRELVVFHDPNSREGSYASLPRNNFFEKCKLSNSKDPSGKSSSMVKILLDVVATSPLAKPSNLKSSTTYTGADYAQHIRKLKKKLPNDEFKIVIEKPFVVVGDESLERIQSRSKRTVKWATDMLKKQYFNKDPKYILDVWLFKDKTSYNKHNKKLFGETPSTPYGYYSPTNKALVMNIATGGGTLVHEIVHPFIESNFDECPSWFNEGLGSLYEQCREKNGKIMGDTNWRLDGLQRSIRNSGLQSFEQLLKTTRREFYGDARGNNYAMARYLCYYLQEQGLLNKFYKAFQKNVGSDPSGFETLQTVLGKPDMVKFQKSWESYVMKLRR